MTGAFPKNVVPGNEFSFHIFTTFYVVALVQLESRRCLQIAFLLYHRDINTKRFADVGHRTDSDLRLFTYSLMNYCFSWLGIKPSKMHIYVSKCIKLIITKTHHVGANILFNKTVKRLQLNHVTK